uniref:hypothetical protein n=1 Tax=Rhizobium croatiense TaxID=2867516 RepID=UPI001FED6A27|nr:hypothetical protein [Rhizobium croatiense]
MVRDLVVRAEMVRYRRECWVTPEGRTIIAPLPAGIKGGYGASLRRFCLMLHSHGQVTTQRLTTLLNDVGVEITASSLAMIATKRQVIRFLTERLDGFHAEDAAVLHAGLVSAPFVTVDDTGARHANRNFHTTQIGGEQFTAFRTTPSKSRLNFLALLRGNYQDYVLNDAAFTFLENRQVDPALLAHLKTCEPRRFANQVPFLEYLAANGIDIFDKDMIRPFAEAGIWERHPPSRSGRQCGDRVRRRRTIPRRHPCAVLGPRRAVAAQADARDARPSETRRNPARACLALLQGSESLSAKT